MACKSVGRGGREGEGRVGGRERKDEGREDVDKDQICIVLADYCAHIAAHRCTSCSAVSVFTRVHSCSVLTYTEACIWEVSHDTDKPRPL